MSIRKTGMALWLAMAAAGCGAPNAYIEPPPPEVTVSNPIKRTVTEYLEFSGMTQPMETVEIRARVKGFLKEKHFVEGAEVKKGQLLLVIDEETFQIQLDAARTRLREAQAALQQATVSKSREVARARVNLSESEVRLARQEEQRVRGLFQKQIATESDMDQASSTRKSRDADLESAKANLEQALATYETTILTCEAQVESAKIAVQNAQLDLSYCRMSAPIDGRISHINVDIGNLVGDGQSSVLATIVKMNPIYAYATISESDVLRTPALTKFGSESTDSEAEPVPVELGLASQNGFPAQGQINYTDPGLDAGTGTLRVRGVFQNEDRSLLPGMFVRMRIPVVERVDALLVPERALGTDQSGQYLLVVAADGTVEYRPVRTGVSVDGLRVVEGQISLSDQLIVDGLLRARPGAKVSPKTEPAPATVSLTTGAGRR
ncbi:MULTISPECIES: efflux RND transporter periplasmic adaptor subunit [unclassified Schlesneria]|uniref:efflux RND transporter periplasmic adaptor subunit n=1 Tax=unclassified Schlesneria TaxID=2762017 RepID=UPI002F0EDDBE